MMSIIPHGSQRNGTFWRVLTPDGREAGARVRLASSFFARLRGLLGVGHLAQGEGLLIVPCNSVHMFFMSIALDIVFLDDAGEVVALLPDLRPWRISGLYPQAAAVLELPAGTCARIGLAKGNRLVFTPAE